jgi:hypothetical protein
LPLAIHRKSAKPAIQERQSAFMRAAIRKAGGHGRSAAEATELSVDIMSG